MAKKYVQGITQYLAGSGVVIGATTIVVQSLTDIYGNVLTMTDFGDKGYGTLEPDTTNEEAFTFTGIVANANGTYSLTGVSTALAKSPYTETAGLVRQHAGGTKMVISDNAAFWNTFANKNNNEVILGAWTAPSGGTGLQIATANDIATAVSGASGTATNLVNGTLKLSVPAVSAPSPIAVGQNDPQFIQYYVDSGAANAYVITPAVSIGAYAVGQRFSFKTTNANTLTSTLNVNALGAKTITRVDGTALQPGDIISGGIYNVIYDGTNFQLLNPTPSSVPSGVIEMYGGAAAPTGWLLCDGTSYLQATFPGLFTAIGTAYGSADGTHFNVPDMRGRVPVGVGTGTGGGASGTGLPTGGSALTAVSRGTWKGEETHQLTVAELASHTHTIINGGGAASNIANGGQGTPNGQNSGSTGGDTAHNNIQPVMGLNFIIKT